MTSHSSHDPTRRGSPNAYFRTKVLTAPPEELRLMLFDGALRFARMAREGFVAGDFDRSYEGATRCQAILLELINTLRPEHDPELCRNLSALYTFMYTRLIDAGAERDPGIVDEVIGLLQYERETWVMLMERLGQANIAASKIASIPDAQPASPSDRTDETGGSRDIVGGRVWLEG